MIDTHCHLNLPALAEDTTAILQRAEKAGVHRIIIPSVDAESSISAVQLAEEHAHLFAAIGIHPTDVDSYTPEARQILNDLVNGVNSVVAIGEVGLDFYHSDNPPLSKQELVFREMIELARSNNLPLIIHSREAFKETYEILKQLKNYSVVLHCFSGTLEEARAWLDLGFYLSFTGMITYKKNQDLRDMIAQLPLDRIMVETDAPFLAPEGYRGETCEPWHVRFVVETLADIFTLTPEEVDKATTQNAQKFFNLPA